MRRPGERVSAWRQPVYALGHELLTAADRVLYRRAFEEVERFCLFAGYARSGHSVVGAVIDAHRHAVIAHELEITSLVRAGVTRHALYARILARSQWFRWYKRNASNYDYRIPGQWQGRFERLRVVGDKRGGRVARALLADPGFAARLGALVGVPVHVVHVVRNPYDNIAGMAIWHRIPVAEAVELYFSHHPATSRLGELFGPERVLTLRHESFVDDPAGAVRGLCAFLGLDCPAEYLEACTRRVFRSPTRTRQKVVWTSELVRRVEERSRPYDFLRGYRFETPEVGIV